MPSFEIPDGPATVKLTEGADATTPRTGSIVFTVNNKSGEVRSGTLSVQVAGQSKAEWFAIDGEHERGFDSANSETVTIKIAVPNSVAAGNYPFRLRVVAVNDPDNDHTDGPATTVEVPPPPPPLPVPKPKWPWIVGALVLLAVIGGLAWAYWPKPDGPVDPVATETAAPTPEVTTEAASPTPEVTALIPDVVGKTLAEATPLATLFVLTPVMAQGGDKPVDQIYAQLPAADSVQNKGIPLRVTIDPGVEVPDLRGTDTSGAVRRLQQIGLHVQSSTTSCDANAVDGQITAQQPGPSERVKANSGVNITVAAVGGTIGRFAVRCRQRFDGVIRMEQMERVRDRSVIINR